MSLTLSDIVIPTVTGGLTVLKNLLEKAAAHADANKIEPSALLQARLYPDMFSFTRQVQTAADTARRGTERLAGREVSSVRDDETSFAELIERVQSTIDQVKKLDRSAIDAAEDSTLSVPMGPETKMDFKGRDYALTFLVPNFYFHVAAAYDILRHNGLVVGKRDYLGPFISGIR